MRPKGLEPPAHCLEGSCSIHLSYGRTLLSQWVPIWRQLCVGTRYEKYNTIPGGFCQEKFQNFLQDFGTTILFAVMRLFFYSTHIPKTPRIKPKAAPATTSRMKCTPASTRSAQMARATRTMQTPTGG